MAVVVGGGYWLLTWVPVYYLHYAVQQVVRDYMNQAVRNSDDAELVRNMVERIRVLDTQQQLDANGRVVEAPTVPLEVADVIWTRDSSAQPPTLHVQFAYTRLVEYPFAHRWTEKTLNVDVMNGDMRPPNWGPAR